MKSRQEPASPVGRPSHTGVWRNQILYVSYINVSEIFGGIFLESKLLSNTIS